MDEFTLTDTPSPFHAEKLQAIGLLTGGVVHDFNNILAIIEGYACILEHQFGSDPDLQEKIAAILTATARGVALTQSLLAFGYPRSAAAITSGCDHDDNTLQNKTVLIVDDEEALLPVLEYQLQNLGLKVLKAANADSALLLQKDYPDAIDFLLTDIVMPDVDGLQLAEIMADDRPRMGVFYMTGHAGMAVPESSLVLPKPLDPEMLSDALRKALEQVGEA